MAKKTVKKAPARQVKKSKPTNPTPKPKPKKNRQVKQQKPGAPVGNTNAEKWDEAKATRLFERALKISADKKRNDNDFIGEVAQAVGTTLGVMEHLRGKFPALQTVYDDIKRNCESNCFRNGKNGTIVPSLAIMNLKSNHGWTDRVQTENHNTNVNVNSQPLSKEEMKQFAKDLENEI